MFVSPALQRGVRQDQKRIESRRDDAGPLPEHKLLIVLDSAIAEKDDKFLFKIAFAVMLFKALNVSLHHRNLRGTHAERAVSLLPGKSMPHPPGGASLEFLNCLGQGFDAGNTKSR